MAQPGGDTYHTGQRLDSAARPGKCHTRPLILILSRQGGQWTMDNGRVAKGGYQWSRDRVSVPNKDKFGPTGDMSRFSILTGTDYHHY